MDGDAEALLARIARKKYLKLTPLSEALDRMKSALGGGRWPIEKVRVDRALMRISSRDVVSRRTLPPRSIAAMDGYAVRSADLKAARAGNPVTLTVRGRLAPSDVRSRVRHLVGPGEAYEVATGAPIPQGSDLVVKVEEVKPDGSSSVKVFREFPQWKNVSLVGEDLRPGSVILRRSEVITPAALALCLGCGEVAVDVMKKPSVGVLSVGTELVEFPPTPGRRRPGGTYNNYSSLVRGYLETRGVEAISLGVCGDDTGEIRTTVEKHLRRVDAIWTIAGSSVGAADLVTEALALIPKSELVFHGLRVLPIRPTGVAVVRRGRSKPVVMLPGHAVSAALATFVVGLPAVNMLLGLGASFGRVAVSAVARERFENDRPVAALLLAKVTKVPDGSYEASPLAWGSNLLHNLSTANGFVRLPAHREFGVSSKVEVELLGPAEPSRISA